MVPKEGCQKSINNTKLAKRWVFFGGVFCEVDDRYYERCYAKKNLTVCRKQSKSLSGACDFKKSSVVF